MSVGHRRKTNGNDNDINNMEEVLNMALKLYKFYEDFGRMGELEGLFITSEEAMQNAYGKTAYFGEVLGKHSDISVTISDENVSVVDIPEDVVEVLCQQIGTDLSGLNPLDCIYDDGDEED